MREYEWNEYEPQQGILFVYMNYYHNILNMRARARADEGNSFPAVH